MEDIQNRARGVDQWKSIYLACVRPGVHFLAPKLERKLERGGGGCSVVKSTCCTGRGPGFGSQHLQW